MTNYKTLLQSEIPEYETKLPSSGKVVKYRPFLVKEEKILFDIQEAKDEEERLLQIELESQKKQNEIKRKERLTVYP